jgi:predicted metal-dependent HD superfamily phosphohydrolase
LFRIDELAAHAVDPDAVRMAAWYHDVTYRGRPDDEENSAQRAETDLVALDVPPGLVGEVARLVRLTTTHDPAVDDRNGETLCDAGLAILTAPPDRYVEYLNEVRAEYSYVPDEEFKVGRSKVLRALLDRPAVYRTPFARACWEAQARANMSAELCRLEVLP